MLSAPSDIQEQIAEGFSLDSDYGVESNGQYSGMFDDQSVTVPEINLRLTNQELEFISNHFNPLDRSDLNGIDIYTRLLEYLTSIL